MTKCKKCKRDYFTCCVNSPDPPATNFICFTCIGPIMLQKWGVGASNTCPLDNFLAACILFHKKYNAFADLISRSEHRSPFERALAAFLLEVDDADNMENAQRNFIQTVYGNNPNLWGTEFDIVFTHLIKTCGISQTYSCNICHSQKPMSPAIKTFLTEFIINEKDSVPEMIQEVLSLRQVGEAGYRCQNDSCNKNPMDCHSAFSVRNPWILQLRLTNDNTMKMFGFKEIESLPRTVQFNNETYEFAGVTFNVEGHFIAVLPTTGGFIVYDGLSQGRCPGMTLRNALIEVANRGGLISSILYFKVPTGTAAITSQADV